MALLEFRLHWTASSGLVHEGVWVISIECTTRVNLNLEDFLPILLAFLRELFMIKMGEENRKMQ